MESISTKLLIQIIIALVLAIVIAGGMVYVKNLDTRVVEESFATRLHAAYNM